MLSKDTFCKLINLHEEIYDFDDAIINLLHVKEDASPLLTWGDTVRGILNEECGFKEDDDYDVYYGSPIDAYLLNYLSAANSLTGNNTEDVTFRGINFVKETLTNEKRVCYYKTNDLKKIWLVHDAATLYDFVNEIDVMVHERKYL